MQIQEISKKLTLSIIYLLFCIQCAYSVTKKGLSFRFDSNYVKSYRKTITFTPVVSTKVLGLNLFDSKSSVSLKLRPSPYLSSGLEIDTRLWCISISPGFMNYRINPQKYKESFHFDSKALLNLNPFIIYFNLQLYRSFYLKNKNEIEKTYQSTWHQNYDDLFVFTLGFNAYYVANYKKFAFTAPYNYIATQIKSAGSLITGLSYEYFDINKKGGLIDSTFTNKFSYQSNFKNAFSNYYTLNVGYGYSLAVKKKFYVTATILIGGGINNLGLIAGDSANYRLKNQFAIQTNLRYGAGWDNGKIYAGVNGIYNEYFLNVNNSSTLEIDKISFKLFAGYRFNYAKLEKKLLRK